MDLKEWMKNLKKNWIAFAVACIVMGLILLLWPAAVLESVGYILGGIAIASGIIRMVRYFKQSHVYPVLFQNDLMVGLFTLGLGIFMVSNIQAVMSLIPVLCAIILVGFGIANILRSVEAKKAGYERWGILLVLAILTLILGLLILMDPFGSLTVTVAVIGGGLIYEGITDILSVQLAGKQIEAWRKNTRA